MVDTRDLKSLEIKSRIGSSPIPDTRGGVAEWTKAAVLKTVEAKNLRGFESHLLRHKNNKNSKKRGGSSIGRAAVSKTAGYRFKSYPPCHFFFSYGQVAERLGSGLQIRFTQVRILSCPFKTYYLPLDSLQYSSIYKKWLFRL